ncbi:MlaD family protein [Marispirochaeta sp.]|jgi:phospholipid/cholesterol/gamma-HCH transport system substrate-binding protein|uniref:MlaD family protein n=1 Tax=Marispirochaeta sp. TaxID=2038653 RepID=UPI0029C62BE0|nr:MlaD family protein [Marispirochaeta sp.]
MSRLVKIGLFVLITGAGSIYYIVQTADSLDAPSTYQVQAYIDDASGLRPGTQVWVAGVDVGRIREIELERGKARLMMELSSNVPVYQDAVIRKQTQSMLGNAIVSLDPGTPQAIPIRNGEVIQNVVSSSGMEQAFGSIDELAREMESFMKNLNSFMTDQGGYAAVEDILILSRETVSNTNRLVEANLLLLQESLENIAEVTGTMRANSDSDLRDLSAILRHTAGITERIDLLLAEQNGRIAGTMQSLQESVDNLNASLASIKAVTSKIERGEGNIGKLINDEELYTKIDRVVTGVDEYVDSALGMDIQVGFRSEYMAVDQHTKNHAEVRVVHQDKGKYYSVGVVSSLAGMSDSDSDGDDELKFSAQLAREYGPLTFRGGLIESSVGLGLEFNPLHRLNFASEVFSFNQDDAPYLRGYGTFYPIYDPRSNNPLNWLYLAGGIDNALTSDRDYFLGLGLRFTDNDLKGILPYAPSP